ncbi:MAG: tyrosine-type recombinase/integrase [Aestuariibacter sp.]|nr:tyrosine-type recombinase/integrase [Aestuariibacter sp.]
MTPLRQKLLDATRQRGYSIETYNSYAVAIRQLIKFYHRPPDQISLCELQPFFDHLVKERRLAPSSCQSYWHGIRFFYENVMGWPAFDVPLIVPKRPQRIPELLTRGEVTRIIGQLSNVKHRTLMQCCYGCGLRLAELVSIKVRHIDSERHLLRIEQGKGAKDRAVILPETLLLVLREYWRHYRPKHWLFEGQCINRHLTRASVQHIYTKAKRQAGIEKVGGIHSLRHAYATHQLEAGIHVHKLQYLLGHRSINSTLHYVHWIPNYREEREAGIDLIADLERIDE